MWTLQKPLSRTPRPVLVAEVLIFVLTGDQNEAGHLGVLLVREGGRRPTWSLPAEVVKENQPVALAAAEVVTEAIGELVTPLELVSVANNPEESRHWTVGVAHRCATFAVTPQADNVTLALISQDDDGQVMLKVGEESLSSAELSGKQGEVLLKGLAALRRDYRMDVPDPAQFLRDDEFTMTQLRNVHEAVLGQALARDTFRRHMEPQLQRSATVASGGVGRPGALYTRV